MLKTITIALIFGGALALFACGDDAACTEGEKQCAGEQIQECAADGTWGEATDCDAGQMCSTGHDGMAYVHCMEMEHGMDDDMDGME